MENLDFLDALDIKPIPRAMLGVQTVKIVSAVRGEGIRKSDGEKVWNIKVEFETENGAIVKKVFMQDSVDTDEPGKRDRLVDYMLETLGKPFKECLAIGTEFLAEIVLDEDGRRQVYGLREKAIVKSEEAVTEM